jgi:hypothetical protein
MDFCFRRAVTLLHEIIEQATTCIHEVSMRARTPLTLSAEALVTPLVDLP